ncbi:MAG: hypothetical protein Tp178MES00d2C33159851_85 [Prokaryotic dsDNA virus sp.]|nr:MAG: hypothetical protein Tp178MES00d2C33159851_85 [Prokaryotic dsDNA virus sp.]
MEDFRLRQRVDNNEAELQALKEYIKILEKRLFEIEQRTMEGDGK